LIRRSQSAIARSICSSRVLLGSMSLGIARTFAVATSDSTGRPEHYVQLDDDVAGAFPDEAASRAPQARGRRPMSPHVRRAAPAVCTIESNHRSCMKSGELQSVGADGFSSRPTRQVAPERWRQVTHREPGHASARCVLPSARGRIVSALAVRP
jgi:hypothetical protein